MTQFDPIEETFDEVDPTIQGYVYYGVSG